MFNFIDSQTLDLLQRIVFAVVLGCAIGVERDFARKVAGMRTHALVALGSALFSIASMAFTSAGADPTRIAAQIVTGIGFLGAGIIIFQDHKIQGLTTAAGIWVAAAVGMACGFGMYGLAAMGTVLTITIFVVLWPIEHFLEKCWKDRKKPD
ncbi:MAG: MgtC/SapB family protein [Candidatus Pacebacteria bacterium]|nr:MgtC/SapB family protein [Candidatus Paceibacterota bacterium]